MALTNMIGVLPVEGSFTDVTVTGSLEHMGGTCAELEEQDIVDYAIDLTTSYLEVRGLTVIDRDWRCQEGSCELVARDGDTAILVDVRVFVSGATVRQEMPAVPVSYKRRRTLDKMSVLYLATHCRAACVRCDVVDVHVSDSGAARLRHVRGVFTRGSR